MKDELIEYLFYKLDDDFAKEVAKFIRKETKIKVLIESYNEKQMTKIIEMLTALHDNSNSYNWLPLYQNANKRLLDFAELSTFIVYSNQKELNAKDFFNTLENVEECFRGVIMDRVAKANIEVISQIADVVGATGDKRKDLIIGYCAVA